MLKMKKFDIFLKKLKLMNNPNLVYKIIDSRKIHRTKYPLLKICIGMGIDVGCGSDKIIPGAIGIDITGRGEYGRYGSQKNQISQADIKTSGDNLYMFKDNSLDYVVSRDNIEHYVDFIKALKEWNRVLKNGGNLGITTPNDDEIDSLRLDSTHKHAFNPSSLKSALEICGFKVLEMGTTIKGWGFYAIAKKMKDKK